MFESISIRAFPLPHSLGQFSTIRYDYVALIAFHVEAY